MNAKNYIFISLFLLGTLLNFTACKEEEYVLNPSGEVFIYKLNITNGGLTGAETYAGTIVHSAAAPISPTMRMPFQVPRKSTPGHRNHTCCPGVFDL